MMNNKVAWSIVVLIILAAGIFAYTKFAKDDTRGPNTNQSALDDSKALGVVLIAGSPNIVWPGNEISSVKNTLTLKNGVTVTSTGTIMDKNGVKIILQENEFLSTEGARRTVDISIYKLIEPTEPDPAPTNTGAPHGDYIDYSEAAVATAQQQNKKVVIFFNASWCPFCKAANKAFLAKIDQIPQDVAILKTDYDASVDLKQKYGVTYQHTFVQIDNQGNQVTKWSGGDIENLKKYIK